MKTNSFMRFVLPPVVVAVVVIVLLEIVVRAGLVQPFLVPAPSAVAGSFSRDGSTLLRATLETTTGASGGFGIGVVIGMAIAVALAAANIVRRAFYPYAVFFQTVPIVAIAPMLVIWIGNDIRAVIASAAIVCVFPIIANTLVGLRSTDPAMLDLFKLYRANRFDTLVKLRLPAALPQVLAGLRVGAGLSVVGAIVGEFITTGSGLGGLMTIARQQQRVDLVFAALILSAALGMALFLLINALGFALLRHWHASEKQP